MTRSTPSTAFTHVAGPPRSRRRTGKCFVRRRTSRTGSVTRGAFGLQEPAAGDAAVTEMDVVRLVHPTAGEGVGAARVEGAPARESGQVGGLAGNRVERLLAAELRHRAEQSPRVGMLGVVEQL